MLCTGYQAWSFADKHCIAHSHSRMRAAAVGLLSLRYVHWVHQVHQVHLTKCFVTKLAPQLLTAHRVSGLVCLQGLIASPCTPAPGGTGWRGRSRGTQGGVGSKNVAKCFENLPAFLRKDFRNLLPRFARGGTTIARHCDFLSPLDPFLGSLAYRRVSVVTACFLCGFMPLYPWHARFQCPVFRR